MSTAITISMDQYNDMLESIRWLDALEAAGVDNWQGFDEAQRSFRENGGKDDDQNGADGRGADGEPASGRDGEAQDSLSGVQPPEANSAGKDA